MKRHFVKILLFSGIWVASWHQTIAQDIEVIDVAGLEQLLQSSENQLVVMNFWATWCKPCIAELPYFESAREQFADQNVRFVLVSLDFEDVLETKVKKFAAKKNLQSELYLLNELDANKWVDKVSPEWQGDIPATLIFNNAKGIRAFYAQEFSQEELNTIIEQSLN